MDPTNPQAAPGAAVAEGAAPTSTTATTPPAEGARNTTAPAAPTGDSAISATRALALHEAAVAARAVLPPGEVDAIQAEAIRNNWSPEAFRAAAFDRLMASGRPATIPAAPNSHQTSMADPAVMIDAMATAIAARAMPGRFQVDVNGPHAQFMGWRASDMIQELLRARGERNVPRDPAVLAVRAMTTSDFPLLLSNSANKMLLAAYQPAAPSYRAWSARRDFNDFKAHTFLRAGDFPALQALGEGGEIKVGTISEGKETVTLATYARGIRITRQMLVNDDLGAFSDFGAMIGRRVADFENATAFSVLNTSNGDGPLLNDGVRVFSTAATRKNKASSASLPAIATIASARTAMMTKKTLDGIPIALGQQMVILAGPQHDLTIRQLAVQVTAQQYANVNPYSSLITPVIDAQITTTDWYAFADPAFAPVYIHGFLRGSSGPMVNSGPVQGTDGFSIDVVHDFGFGAIDYRGGWHNGGLAGAQDS